MRCAVVTHDSRAAPTLWVLCAVVACNTRLFVSSFNDTVSCVVMCSADSCLLMICTSSEMHGRCVNTYDVYPAPTSFDV